MPRCKAFWIITDRRCAGLGSLITATVIFYFALYWAQALASQKDDADVAAHFTPIAGALAENEAKIIAELAALQGKAVYLGGYYNMDAQKSEAAMRGSQTFLKIIG